MRLLAQAVELVDIILCILLKVITVDIFELDLLDFDLIVLIPVFLEVPDIFQVFDLFINIVKVSWRSIADLEHLEAKYHIIPAVPQPLNNVIEFV